MAITDVVVNEFMNALRARIITVDLLAANARYHKNCYRDHIWNPYLKMKMKKVAPPGRPFDDKISREMEKIFQLIDSSQHRHFSYHELFEVIGK